MKRWGILAAVAAAATLIGAAGYLGIRGGDRDGGDSVRAPVTVAVTRGDVQQTVVAPGRAVGTKEVVLGMRVGGQLEELNVRPGSVVDARDVLARLDRVPLKEALEAARQEQARRLIEGLGPLPTQEVKRAESDLAASALAAPFGGVILEVMARLGESVGAGQPIVILADPESIELQTRVIEEDLPLIEPGQAVELFFDAAPDDSIMGEVARIVPRRVEGQDRPLYHVYVSLDRPPEGVVSGMTADASIIVAQRSDVLRLPRAVVRAPSGGVVRIDVWVDGRVETRTAKVGLRGDVNVEILEGLREGDAVVAE